MAKFDRNERFLMQWGEKGMELEVQTTIDDPKTHTSPWVTRQVLRGRPDYLVLSEHDGEETGGAAEDAEKYGYAAESP